MPSIGGRCGPQGIIVQLSLASPGAVDAAIKQGKEPKANTYSALLDTGASGTCISPLIVQQLGLQPVGMVEVQAAGGTHSANRYLVDLFLNFGQAGLRLGDIEVNEFNVPKENGFQALLGMDVINRGCFTLSFDGHYTFSI